MNFRIIYLMLIILIGLFGCGKEPVFTEMSTNRLKIVIKGTFETEGVSNFVSFPGPNSSLVEDSNSVDKCISPSDDAAPTTLMIDIAEIRLGGKKISNYRRVLEIPLDDSQPFFNGTGVEIETDDPGEGDYNTVELYIRKMIFDKAKIYQFDEDSNSYSYEKEAEVIFHEETRNGFDFNQLMVNSYWDSLRLESDELIRIFPLNIPIIGGMSYSRLNNETVLEIRLVIKNFIKKYEYTYFDDDGAVKLCHYYALSDWLRDVKTGEMNIGRNIHAVARAYVPGKTGSITVNSSAGYVIAIPSDEDISSYGISKSGVSLRGDVGNSDLPLAPSYPGAFIEPLLDYFLKYEKYKYDWNNQVENLVTNAGNNYDVALDNYEAAWDTYEEAVKGFSIYGLKTPPYVAYSTGTSAVFSNMAPGTYKFYRANKPSYGLLFLNSDFTQLNGGAVKEIVEGNNEGF